MGHGKWSREMRKEGREPSFRKPVDRWFSLAGIAIGVMFSVVIPRSQTSVALGLLLTFALLAHPLWHFWWVEQKVARRIVAEAILLGILVFVGKECWPSMPPQPETRNAAALPPPGARLLMSKALVVQIENRQNNQRGVVVNFSYNNYGSVPSLGEVHKAALIVSDAELSHDQLAQYMQGVESFDLLPTLLQQGDELYPNDPSGRFFSIPGKDETIEDAARFYDDIVLGKKRVYFLVIKYRDSSMASDVVGVAETCGWFLKDFETVHNCINRVFSTKEQVGSVAAQKPTLALAFSGRSEVSIDIQDTANIVARDIVYSFGMVNVDHPNTRFLPSGEAIKNFIPIPSSRMDFINPGKTSSALILPSDIEAGLRPGDRVFGCVFVSCPGCDDLRSWLYIKFGEAGWYSLSKDAAPPSPTGLMENPEQMIDKFVPVALRTPIK